MIAISWCANAYITNPKDCGIVQSLPTFIFFSIQYVFPSQIESSQCWARACLTAEKTFQTARGWPAPGKGVRGFRNWAELLVLWWDLLTPHCTQLNTCYEREYGQIKWEGVLVKFVACPLNPSLCLSFTHTSWSIWPCVCTLSTGREISLSSTYVWS